MSANLGSRSQSGSSQHRPRPPVILVIEDDEVLADLLRQTLEDQGYQVVTATDGVPGLARIRAGGVDLVLLDLMMPGLNGLEVCWQARQQTEPRAPHVPILILTACIDDETQRAGFIAGADDYVTKPFDVEVLLARIGVWLRQRGYAEELIAARERAEVGWY